MSDRYYLKQLKLQAFDTAKYLAFSINNLMYYLSGVENKKDVKGFHQLRLDSAHIAVVFMYDLSHLILGGTGTSFCS